MKIEKRVLSEVLKVLGKVARQTSPEMVQRSVRFAGAVGDVRAMATDGMEVVLLKIEAECTGEIDFSMELGPLREIARSATGEIELDGAKLDWPVVEVVPAEALTVELPDDFCELLKLAAPIVDQREVRRTLQGINLSQNGITVTDGKQLLHLPLKLELPEDFTLPFPLALLTAMPEGTGTLQTWAAGNGRNFRLVIGNFVWHGRAIDGKFPNWQQVIPGNNMLNSTITLCQPTKVAEFLKTVPNHPPYDGIELNVTAEGISVIPVDFPAMEFKAEGDISGVRPRAVLTLNKHILLRILQQGYDSFHTNADGQIPVIAKGGKGMYLAMPIRSFRNVETQKQPQQEEKFMEEKNKFVETPAMVAVSPFDELNANVEELRGKLKTLFDESAVLVRKVKEAALLQKQKEREFVQARKAIERIRLASGF